MKFFSNIKESLLHLAFPHLCAGCGKDYIAKDRFLCIECFDSLPETSFHLHANNPIEKMFWGRIPVTSAAALYYFTKESLIQRLMHQFKYKGRKELGFFLGQTLGTLLMQSNRFRYIDALVPLPLFRVKEQKRGFNQAAVLCEGMASVMDKPVLLHSVKRVVETETQTKKSRIERWQNIEGKFALVDTAAIAGKHVLLVDDVITTGATIEACGKVLLEAENTRLSVAALCFSST